MNLYHLMKKKKYKCLQNKSQTYFMETEVNMNKNKKLIIN